MTPPPAETASPALDPITLAATVRATLDAVPHHPDAPAEEQEANRHTAFTMIGALCPRDPLEAMLAARIVATYFHIMDDMCCAAQRDLPPALKLRFRANAAALTRVQERAERDLKRRQAFPALQPATLPVAVPAPRPRPAPVAVAAPGPAAGGFVPPTEAEVVQLVAGVMASQDAQAAAAKRRQAGAAAADPADDDFAEPTEAEVEAVVARARALLEETAPPAVDMAARLLAEVAARAAAVATKLAA
jgi:hypothetical protein